MKKKLSYLLITLSLIINAPHLLAGQYYALCEGNYGQANASLWSFDEAISVANGPLVWNSESNPLGDVGQSMTLYNHKLYLVMNNSHTIRILDLEDGITHVGDVDIPASSPRYMAIQASQSRGFVSSWGLGALLVIDLSNDTVVDTLLLNGLPEEIQITGDRLFVSMAMLSDWSANNQVLEYDISSIEPEFSQSYTVVSGPGSMTRSGDKLFVTSIYYNDAWESFSGTSSIDLNDGTVQMQDHGNYTNYSADIDIVDGVPYRIFGNFIVPLNEDLSLNPSGVIANTEGLYSFSVQNELLILGISDFVAPDEIFVYSAQGSRRGMLTLGGLPGDVIYYDPTIVNTDDSYLTPKTFSLGANYPNPFNPRTQLPITLQTDGFVNLSIYDVRGQLVKTLLNTDSHRGEYALTWDGFTDQGELAASGIYFAVLRANDLQSTIKMNLIR